MAAPTVFADVASFHSSSTTNHVITLPTYAAGDLLLVAASTDTNQSASYPAGWTKILDENGGNEHLSVAYRVADGTEGSSVTYTTGASRRSEHHAFTIRNHDSSTNPPEGNSENGNSGDPDPPSLSPSGGSADYLAFALVDTDGSGHSVTTYPTSFGDNQGNHNTSGYQLIGFCTQGLSAQSSVDPSAFVMDSSTLDWCAATVCIYPGSESGGSSSTTVDPSVGTVTIQGAQPSAAGVTNPTVATLEVLGAQPQAQAQAKPPTGTLTVEGSTLSELYLKLPLDLTGGTLTVQGAQPRAQAVTYPGYGSLIFQGQDAAIYALATAGGGQIIIQGAMPTVSTPATSVTADPTVGTITIQGQQPDVQAVIYPAVGGFTIAGQDQSVLALVAASVGTIVIQGTAPSLVNSRLTIDPGTGNLIVQGSQGSVAIAAYPGVSTLTIGGQDTTVQALVGAGAGTLVIQGSQPTLGGLLAEISAGAGTLTIQGAAPGVSIVVKAGVGNFQIQGEQPGVLAVVLPSTATIEVQGAQPSEIFSRYFVDPGKGEIIIQGSAPGLSPVFLYPGYGFLELSGGDVTVIATGYWATLPGGQSASWSVQAGASRDWTTVVGQSASWTVRAGTSATWDVTAGHSTTWTKH